MDEKTTMQSVVASLLGLSVAEIGRPAVAIRKPAKRNSYTKANPYSKQAKARAKVRRKMAKASRRKNRR